VNAPISDGEIPEFPHGEIPAAPLRAVSHGVQTLWLCRDACPPSRRARRASAARERLRENNYPGHHPKIAPANWWRKAGARFKARMVQVSGENQRTDFGSGAKPDTSHCRTHRRLKSRLCSVQIFSTSRRTACSKKGAAGWRISRPASLENSEGVLLKRRARSDAPYLSSQNISAAESAKRNPCGVS